MSGNGKYLRPGARLENLLPAFAGSGAGSRQRKSGGHSRARQRERRKVFSAAAAAAAAAATASAGQSVQTGSKHQPPTGSLWENPANAKLQARSRAADAQFDISLSMPVPAAKESRNTDECIPAYQRRGLERRPSQPEAVFVVDDSPVFRPHHQARSAGIPGRTSQRIANDEEEHGAQEQSGAPEKGSYDDDDVDLAPVRMHPFFSGIDDDVMDPKALESVTVQGLFFCTAPDVNFDLFELDRTSNKSTWHSLEPRSSSSVPNKEFNYVRSASDEGEGVDFVRIALGSAPAVMTKRWVRAATYACGVVKFHRSTDPPSAAAVATHGLRVNVVAASTLPPIESSDAAGTDEGSGLPQPFLTETAEKQQVQSTTGGGDDAATGTSDRRRSSTVRCTTNLEDGDSGCTFDARFNVQGQLPILNDTGPLLVFVDGVQIGELTAENPQLDAPRISSGAGVVVVDQKRGMELHVCVGDVASASQDAYQVTWTPLKIGKTTPAPAPPSAKEKQKMLAAHQRVIADFESQIEVVNAELAEVRRKGNFLEAVSVQDRLRSLQTQLREAKERDIFFVPPPPRRFGTTSLSVMSQRNIDWRTHSLKKNPTRPRASGGGLVVKSAGDLVPKLRVIVQPV